MLKLDRSKPFGKVSPPLILENVDRPACYEQNGVLFDAHDIAVLGGSSPPAAERQAAPIADANETPMSVEALIAAADEMPYQTWAKQARVVLGPTCPSGKKAILLGLEEARSAYLDRQARRSAPPAAAEPAPAVVASPQVAQPATKSGIDLAAWGRGQRDYLFGEVQREVRKQYNAQLSERWAVVDFLIEQSVITAGEARKDV